MNSRKLPKFRKNHNTYYENQHLKRYGLTIDHYNILEEIQKKKCAICGRKINLEIDHDHKTTKQFRGFLCHNCNLMIGYSHDNPLILISGARYIIKYKIYTKNKRFKNNN